MKGSDQVYKWDHTKIIVSFDDQSHQGYGHNQQSHNTSQQLGSTPSALRNLVNGRLVGGEADDEMVRRGYELRNNSVSGDNVYTSWREQSTIRCVTVHSVNSRYKSIVYVPDAGCTRKD